MNVTATFGRRSATNRVVVVGAGPVGMTMALALAQHGVRVLVIERRPGLSEVGSRAIALLRHTLQAWERLGAAGPILEQGLQLVGSRTFFRDVELKHEAWTVENGLPRAVMLQQTRTERALLDAVEHTPLIDVDFGTEVTGLEQHDAGVRVRTSRGPLDASYVVACDGAASPVRAMLRVPFPGRMCRDRFLIADVRASLPDAKERRFWFDPASNPGGQVLMIPQPDDEWRIDWQVEAETDPDEERRSRRIHRRIRALIGDGVDYELGWISSYRFQRRVARRFRTGRVFLAGDAAHLVPPFGARGLTSGVEDAVNLAWKLAFVIARDAPDALLDSYHEERHAAARVNVRITGATTRFMAPPTPWHRAYREAVLRLSVHEPRLRRYVNDYTPNVPAVYASGRHPLVGHLLPEPGDVAPGRLTCLVVSGDNGAADCLASHLAGLPLRVAPHHDGVLGIPEGSVVLVRPDGYVSDVVRGEVSAVRAAVKAALRRR